MQLALALFPATDGLDGLIEQSMPWLLIGLVLIGLVLTALFLSGVIVLRAAALFRRRSPVERILRRGFR